MEGGTAMRSGKSAGRENGFWHPIRAVCWGTAAGAAVIMLLILLFTFAFVKLRQVPQAAAVPLTIAAASAGAFVGGCVSGGIARQKGILYGFSSGLLLFVLLFLCGVILVREPLAPAAFIKLALMIFFGVAGGILGVNRRSRVRIR